MDPLTIVAIVEGCFKLAEEIPSLIDSVSTIAKAVHELISGSDAIENKDELLARITTAQNKMKG
jgi:aspartyl/asparaginyl-tRNA synthetase